MAANGVDDPQNLTEPLIGASSSDARADNSWQDELLAALDSLEKGRGATESRSPEDGGEDGEPFEMEELIAEKPDDVISYLENEGLLKLGEFDVDDCVALDAFGQETILTAGHDYLDFGWEALWRDRLARSSRTADPAKSCRWSATVTLEAYVVNLLDAAAEGHTGLLQPLIQRHQARHCATSVFALPAVQAVIHFKWNTWARTYLLLELLVYMIWLSSFMTFTLVFVPENSSQSLLELLSTARGVVAVGSDLAATGAMIMFLYMEVCTMVTYRLGWISMGNMADLCSYGLQLTILFMHTSRLGVASNALSLVVAIQHVLLWTKMHYYARVFNATKNIFLDTIRIVVADLKWFLLFLGLTMMGFGFAFYALFRNDSGTYPDFLNIWHSFASMFEYLLAMFDYNVFYKSKMPAASLMLFCLYEFVFNILLLNLLIAMMTNAYAKVNQTEGLRFLLNRATVIGELEATLPVWTNRRDWTPKYVHLLRRAPPSGYEPNLHSIWSGIGVLESNLLGAQAETRLRVEEIEKHLGSINRKLDFMVQMLVTAPAGPRAAAMTATAAWAAPQQRRLNSMSMQPPVDDHLGGEFDHHPAPALSRASLPRLSRASAALRKTGSQRLYHQEHHAGDDDDVASAMAGMSQTARLRHRTVGGPQATPGAQLKRHPSL